MSDHRQKGSVLIEAALLLPMVLLLLFGIVEFGRFLVVSHGVNRAAREGARYGVAVGLTTNGIPRYTDCDEIKAAAIDLAGLANLVPTDITVAYDHGSGGAFHNCTSGNPAAAAIVLGDRVVVTATRQFQTGIPLIRDFLNGITVAATDTRTIFKEPPPP